MILIIVHYMQCIHSKSRFPFIAETYQFLKILLKVVNNLQHCDSLRLLSRMIYHKDAVYGDLLKYQIYCKMSNMK
jgi:hypothetical protein